MDVSNGVILDTSPHREKRPSPGLLSLRSVDGGGGLDGCSPLEEKIMFKYIETFPSYTMEADKELLQTRARESIERAREEFEQGLDIEGTSELSGEGLSASERADKFFTDDSVRRAATDYVWKREMARIVGKDQRKTQTTRFIAQGLTFVLFAPVWYYFFTNVPTREFKEVFAYSAKVIQEAMGTPPF